MHERGTRIRYNRGMRNRVCALRGGWGALALLFAAVICSPSGVVAQPPAAPAAIIASAPRLVIEPSLQAEPFSGRVYIVLMEGKGEPRRRMNDWFRPPLIFSKDVSGLEGGVEVALDESWLAYPKAWKDVPPGEYAAQAIVRRGELAPNPGYGPDDLVSDAVSLILPLEGDDEVGLLRVKGRATQRPFKETDRVKLVEFSSPLLSAFHGRDYKVRAGVLLPEGYKDDGTVSYPVVYSITGFGGDHIGAHGIGRLVPPEAAAHVIMVVPDPLCYRGHSVFADSANNGPWGRMLVKELAPTIEKRYNGAGPGQRYVTGVSSGGWSSLWLQVTYPREFAGCWSHCPDPVDFRDFQQINLYRDGENMYKDPAGERRPLARRGDGVALWYDDFCRREWVLGPGGQIHSFEAVFSPKAADGTPELLFDRATGGVNAQVAKYWERYDIRLVLERSWPSIGPRLAGKLHIYAGGVDTFYLEGAVKLLKESLAGLQSDAVVEIIDGMPHTLHREGNAAMFKAILEKAGIKPAEQPAPTDATGDGEQPKEPNR